MNFTRFFFKPVLFLSTVTVATCTFATPSHAVELIFSSPRVLSAINGVSFALPSTGVIQTFNVTLKRGNLADVFGTPPKFDISNEIDAVFVMDKSAQGINSFLLREPGDIWFESFGTDVFYLPYGINQTNEQVLVSRSKYAKNSLGFASVAPNLTEINPNTSVVFASIVQVQVPEPSSVLGTLIFGTFATGAIMKCKLKQKKLVELGTIA